MLWRFPIGSRRATHISALCVVVGTVIVSACDTEVEEDDSGAGSSTSTASAGSGGTPSVASSTAAAGGGQDTGLQCFSSYTNVPIGECDLLRQNCPFGQGCEVVLGGTGYTTACVADTGLMGAGDPCLVDESCHAGLYCVLDSCSPICCPQSNEPCGVSGICIVNQQFGTLMAQACAYLESCTLFTNDCEEDSSCYPLLESGSSVCAPNQNGTVGEGESCTALNDCDDSMVCSGSTCSWACLLDGMNLSPGAGGCPVGQTCGESGSNPPQNIGVCS